MINPGAVYLKAVIGTTKDENGNETDIPFIAEFEDFHDAWVWIRDCKDEYTKLTNPTINPEIQEIPTAERAERLYRYACNILEDKHG